jgi:hypothetical protein
VKLDAGATFMISTGAWSAEQVEVHSHHLMTWDVISAQADTADVDIELLHLTV